MLSVQQGIFWVYQRILPVQQGIFCKYQSVFRVYPTVFGIYRREKPVSRAKNAFFDDFWVVVQFQRPEGGWSLNHINKKTPTRTTIQMITSLFIRRRLRSF